MGLWFASLLASLSFCTRKPLTHCKSIANYLDVNDFKRAVAGEADFSAAVKALAKMHETGLGIIISGKYGCGKTLIASIAAKNSHTGLNVRLGVPMRPSA